MWWAAACFCYLKKKTLLPPQHTVHFKKAQLDLPGENMKSTDSSRQETSRCEAERFLIISFFSYQLLASQPSLSAARRKISERKPDALKYHMAANQTRPFSFSEETCSETVLSQCIYFPLHFSNSKNASMSVVFSIKSCFDFFGKKS